MHMWALTNLIDRNHSPQKNGDGEKVKPELYYNDKTDSNWLSWWISQDIQGN